MQQLAASYLLAVDFPSDTSVRFCRCHFFRCFCTALIRNKSWARNKYLNVLLVMSNSYFDYHTWRARYRPYRNRSLQAHTIGRTSIRCASRYQFGPRGQPLAPASPSRGAAAAGPDRDPLTPPHGAREPAAADPLTPPFGASLGFHELQIFTRTDEMINTRQLKTLFRDTSSALQKNFVLNVF